MLVDFNDPFYSYDKLVTDAKTLAKQYETILQYVTIGRSQDNRDIVLLKLGIGKQHMVCCAGVHARETVNPVVMLRIIEYYADLYVNHRQQKLTLKRKLNNPTQNLKSEYEQMLYGSCIYELLQTYTILIVPLLNPDGYMISLDGFDAIRDPRLRELCISLRIPQEEWKYNAAGIDINRNFPSKLWKTKFEGDCPAGENETKALIGLFNEYKSKGFLDFHSRGKQIYYYRSQMPDSYNTKQYEIASRLKKIMNYELMPPEEEVEASDSGGNTVHYYSEVFRKPALTIETVEEQAGFPLDIKYRQPTFEELKLVIFKFGSMII
jgi:g-D-glutamyl-meso-diaminopimelate peptidase